MFHHFKSLLLFFNSLFVDDPVEIAREKLQRAVKAAQALSGIEKELGLEPSTIENKTAKLETELHSEEKNFKKLADEAQDPAKRAKFNKFEKDADEDVKKAENILKLIVKLEAAKYLAKERAQEDLEKAEKRKMASMPQAVLGQPLSYPPQVAGYLGGIQQPVYQPAMQSYTASYQPQMFQGTSPNMASAPNSMLSPSRLTVPSTTAPVYQPTYQDNAEIQKISSSMLLYIKIIPFTALLCSFIGLIRNARKRQISRILFLNHSKMKPRRTKKQAQRFEESANLFTAKGARECLL